MISGNREHVPWRRAGDRLVTRLGIAVIAGRWQ